MKLLLIIDMLNGFCRKGYPISSKRSTKNIESFIKEKIIKYNKSIYPYFYCCDSHFPEDPEFLQFPSHCLKGSEEARIVDTLYPLSNKSNIIEKRTLSPFLNTQLGAILKKYQPSLVEVVGIYTDICVLVTAIELHNRGYKAIIYRNGVLATSKQNDVYFLNYMHKTFGASII